MAGPRTAHAAFPKTFPKGWRPDKLSPSAAHRWLHCAGSVAAGLCVPATVRNTNAAAEEGTRAHLLLEVMFTLGLRPDEVPINLENEEVNKAMRKAVAFAVQYIHTWQHEHPGNDLHSEHPISVAHHIADNVFGTSDIALVHPGELCILDFKYGMQAVSAKLNPQMMLYALGKLTTDYRPKRVRLVIVQPRLRDGDPVSEWMTTPDELIAWADLTAMPQVHLINTLGIDAPRVAGDWCDWCAARGTCPTLMEKIFQTVGMKWATK